VIGRHPVRRPLENPKLWNLLLDRTRRFGLNVRPHSALAVVKSHKEGLPTACLTRCRLVAVVEAMLQHHKPALAPANGLAMQDRVLPRVHVLRSPHAAWQTQLTFLESWPSHICSITRFRNGGLAMTPTIPRTSIAPSQHAAADCHPAEHDFGLPQVQLHPRANLEAKATMRRSPSHWSSLPPWAETASQRSW